MRIARSSGRRDASRASQSSGMRPVVLGAEARELREADHHRIAEAVQPLHVEHDDLAEVRQPRAHLERLVELLLVLDEQVDRARVGHQVLDLRGGVGRIDAGAHPARAEHAEVGVEPLAPRVREHRGGLARLEAEPARDRGRPRGRCRRARARWCRARSRAPSGGARPCRRGARPRSRRGPERCRREWCSVRWSWGHRQVFLRFQRRSPRTPAACMPR